MDQRSVAILSYVLGKGEELVLHRLVQGSPGGVCFPERVVLAGEAAVAVGGTAGAVRDAVLVVDVVPWPAGVEEVDLVARAPDGVVVQHGGDGAVEGRAVRAGCSELADLAGRELEAADVGAFGAATDDVVGQGAGPVGVLHFVTDGLLGRIVDADERGRSAECDEECGQREDLS